MLDGSIAGGAGQRADLRDLEPPPSDARVHAARTSRPSTSARKSIRASRSRRRSRCPSASACGSRSIRSTRTSTSRRRRLARALRRRSRPPTRTRARGAHARGAAVGACSAARAAAASPGSSRANFAGAQALLKSRRMREPRRLGARRRARVLIRGRRPGAARAAAARQALRGLLGIPRRQGRARRVAARRRSRASCTRSSAFVVRRAAPWLVQEFVYPHAHVELHFFRVFAWDGELRRPRWAGLRVADARAATHVAPLLPANTRILAALALPPVYGITNAEDMRRGRVPRARRARARARACGSSSCATRTWPLAAAPEPRGAAAAAGAAPRGAQCCGTAPRTRRARPGATACIGRRRRSPLRRARPDDLLVAASCHDARRDRPRRRAGVSISRCSDRCTRRRRIAQAAPLGWAFVSRRASQGRVCRSTRSGGSATRTSTPRSTTARTASR